jgi:hypothetical protein
MLMKLSQSIVEAYDTKWSFINSFDVSFQFSGSMMAQSGWNNATDGRNINLHVVSIDTPQFTNSPIEVFVANQWAIHNGRDELYRFSITFRDKDQMSLYRKFVKMYQYTREDYFDNISFYVRLSKDADWLGERDSTLMEFYDTMIESVSQLQFNNTTENQIAEFTVQFKCKTPVIN